MSIKTNEKEINKDSSPQEIVDYFVKTFNYKKEDFSCLIKEKISGDVLPYLTNEDFEELKIKLGHKIKIKKFIDDNINKLIGNIIDIKINTNSSENDVKIFLEKYLDFKGNIQGIDGKKLITMKEKEMKDFGLLLGQRKKLNMFIDYIQKNKKQNSGVLITEEDVANFLKNKFKISDKIIDKLGLDGETLLSLTENDIDKIDELPQETKRALKNFITKEKIKNIIENKNININHENNIKIEDFINNEETQNDEINNNEQNDNKSKKSENKNEFNGDILKEYNGEEFDKIYTYTLNNYELTPIINNSKYNIFFFLIMRDTYIEKIKLSVLFADTKIQYKYYFLSDWNKKVFFGELKFILMQIPVNKDVNKLSLQIEENYKNTREKLEFNYSMDNYFYFDKIIFPSYFKNDVDLIDITKNYFIYFFNDKNKKNERYQIDLIKNISIQNKVEMDEEMFFKFIKYCLYFSVKPRNINKINLINCENKNIIQDNFSFSNNDDSFDLNENEKMQLFIFLIKNYNKYDNNFYSEIINSKYANIYFKIILNDLIDKKNIINLIKFNEEKELFNFQKSLLNVSSSLKEIKEIIKLSLNLTKSLQFLIQNLEIIQNIIDQDKNYKIGKDNFLDFSDINKEDKINDICELISDLMKRINNNEFKKIINFEKLSENLINFHLNKSFKEYSEIKKIVDILKRENLIDVKREELYYQRLHNKGIQLIINKKMKIGDIMKFINEQDIYYYDSRFKKSDLRDPNIFKFIDITNKDKNYLINIKIMKKNKIWILFKESTDEMKKTFYNSFLNQINSIIDLKNIFELFPIDEIKLIFINLISIKLAEFIPTILKQEEENYETIFSVLYDYSECCNINKIKEKCFDINNFEYDFSSKYYFYLLNKKKDKIINHLKNEIITFFFEQNKNNLNAEIIIKLILSSPNDDFCLNILDIMECFVLKEVDFYKKEVDLNFEIFKLFFEKCGQLINNKEFDKGKFLSKSLKIKNEIKNDLSTNKVKFELMNNLIDEDNLFYNKILVIFDNDKDNSIKIYEMLKENLEKCKNKFKQFETIEDYYNTFYKKSKADIINEIKSKLEILRNAFVNIILNTKNNEFINNKDFNYDITIKETENIKYKYSLFFMSIYNEKYNSESIYKDENSIFIETKNNFRKTMTKIINLKETNESFYNIPNINEIIKVIKDGNNNLQNEINFLNEEFNDLNKTYYIKNELLDDLINFSNKEKIQNLIVGIYLFNKSFSSIMQYESTDFKKNLKDILKKLYSDNVTGENIKEAISLLIKLKFDINEETSLMKFFTLFIGKEESIEFIKVIKESNLEIRNLNEFIDENENSQLQITDIDNLIDVYTFLKKIIENKEIKTDEDFHNIFRTKFEKDKNIGFKLQSYLNSYGEIYQLYQLYDENSEMTTQKISKILQDSFLEIYKKDNENDEYTYKIQYLNSKNKKIEIDSKEIDELKNKILISSGSKILNILIKESKNEIISKEELTKKFVELIENIQHLTKVLNQLIESGYPYINNLELQIKNS